MDADRSQTLSTMDMKVETQIQELRDHVERLTRRVSALENGEPPPVEVERVTDVVRDAEERGWAWLVQSALLRRIATISFVLVIALVLRTLTDSEVVDKPLGMWLGIGYAWSLIGYGWRRLSRHATGQRVLPVCGTVLLCAMVYETHARFDLLGAATAHGLLIAVLLASAGLGLRYGIPIVAEAGVLVAPVTAVALGFPLPQFHLTAINLVIATLTAYALAGQRRAAWLHWSTLAVSLFFWLVWSFKSYVVLGRGEVVPAELRMGWFLPALALTFVVQLVLAFRSARGERNPYAHLLPVINIVQACAASSAVLVPGFAAARSLGGIAMLLAGVHMGIAWRFPRWRPGESAPVTGFVVAAAAAFVPGVWLLAGSVHVALPAAALAAFGIARWSGTLSSAGMRALALVLQLVTIVTAIAAESFAAPASPFAAMVGLAAVLALVAVAHYRWSRRVAPPAGSWYARLSATDVPGQLVLAAGLAATFGFLRLVAYPLLAGFSEVENAFSGVQSVLLNLMAVVLLVLAWRRRDRAIVGMAALVSVVGGLKVFGSDFLALHGVPLVLSVFSFGVLALMGSIVLGRWQQKPAAPAP